MPSNFPKFIFLGIIIALALFSRVAYPTFYAISNGAAGSAEAATSSNNGVPIFVFEQIPSSSQVAQVAQAVPPALAAAVSPSAAAANSVVQSPTSVGTSGFTQIGVAAAPLIADRASLIADLETGSILYGTNADSRWPLASLTKLMTAAVALGKMDLSRRVTVTPAAVAVDPQQTTLQAGDVYTVGDLLDVLLLPSSNVAAEALANAYSRPQFLAEMNARAAAWGMASTHYADPSGLSAANQSTASDLLRLAQEMYANYPQVFAVTRMPQVTITELGSGRQVPVKSINDFAGRADFIGGKTGYTEEAAGNLLSVFNYKNRPVFLLVLGTQDGLRFANTLQLYQWFMGNFK